jgi:hypothetical protein
VTAAAERVADRFNADVVFVPLAAITQPEQVLTSIGRAMGPTLGGRTRRLRRWRSS